MIPSYFQIEIFVKCCSEITMSNKRLYIIDTVSMGTDYIALSNINIIIVNIYIYVCVRVNIRKYMLIC